MHLAGVFGALALVLALGPSEHLASAKSAIEAGGWAKARKALKRAAATASKSPGDVGAEEVAELALLRAMTEAAAGNTRLGDWYWWVAKMFADEGELRQLAGGSSESAMAALEAAIRPAPEIEPLDPSLDLSELSGVRRKPGNRPLLVQRACSGFEGSVVFDATTGEGGYYQAPRWSDRHENSAPAACVFSVLETYRDSKGRVPGGANMIRNRF